MINLCVEFDKIHFSGFQVLQKDNLISDPYCSLDLEHGNLTCVHDTPSHYALSFCEVSLN